MVVPLATRVLGNRPLSPSIREVSNPASKDRLFRNAPGQGRRRCWWRFGGARLTIELEAFPSPRLLHVTRDRLVRREPYGAGLGFHVREQLVEHHDSRAGPDDVRMHR